MFKISRHWMKEKAVSRKTVINWRVRVPWHLISTHETNSRKPRFLVAPGWVNLVLVPSMVLLSFIPLGWLPSFLCVTVLVWPIIASSVQITCMESFLQVYFWFLEASSFPVSNIEAKNKWHMVFKCPAFQAMFSRAENFKLFFIIASTEKWWLKSNRNPKIWSCSPFGGFGNYFWWEIKKMFFVLCKYMQLCSSYCMYRGQNSI